MLLELTLFTHSIRTWPKLFLTEICHWFEIGEPCLLYVLRGSELRWMNSCWNTHFNTHCYFSTTHMTDFLPLPCFLKSSKAFLCQNDFLNGWQGHFFVGNSFFNHSGYDFLFFSWSVIWRMVIRHEEFYRTKTLASNYISFVNTFVKFTYVA